MSFSDPFQQGQQPAVAQSAGLSLNLSSNNPFRNRAASPSSIDAAFASPSSPFDDPPPRPLSRNPFLDQAAPPAKSPGAMLSHSNSKSLSAEEIFNSLTLDDKKSTEKPAVAAPAQRRPMDLQPGPRRGENQPLARPPNGNHRPTRSQEEALRARKPQASGPRPGPPDSPQRKPQRRPRRNSESSVLDLNAQPITEDEMKLIEAKRMRDRQRRECEGRSSGRDGREGKDKSKSGRPSRRLDIIDQLDATSIYGTGLFHHDGPFDALNPHRNRQSSRRAPMQAFPKDSLNNSIGGAGPLNQNPDHAVFMGNGTDEAFRDYAGGGRNKNGYNYPTPSNGEAVIFDPIARGNVVHGDESHGLGTSTFLEGTPAARTAIARREAEQAQEFTEGGIQRKKSLAQRIRHINKGQRGDFASSGRMTNPEGPYGKRSPDPMPTGASVGSDSNPFFAEFGKGSDYISVKPQDGAMPPTSPPPVPRRMSGGPLERRATTDATATTASEDAPAKPSGILGRMKSLKGGRRPRNADNGQGPNPGTAM
ncbi:Protein PAL1 [Tolypocladium ophioglossoides CBS 100239]|uniref:Protein PAL1 n=1 Tax=Tolypocladium ophioglossoides (strain CBS 100239) TaxID=1163406 RepID=A0A0L0N6Z2_TOLOC|nr:Protein PAL1 [Tolypocladium ophioglossoides CBS 100239]